VDLDFEKRKEEEDRGRVYGLMNYEPKWGQRWW